MKIGVLGLSFSSSNKGCEALSYSFVNMIREFGYQNLEIHVFGYSEMGDFTKYYSDIRFINHRLKMKNPFFWQKLKKQFDEMDCIFDATFGDGFSDIYGKLWNVTTNLAKQIAIFSSTPFILLPQTYGPYKNILLRLWAKKIVKTVNIAFSRDNDSAVEINKNIIVGTDLAFALPYKRGEYKFDNKKLKIGLNVSSLLWEGGHEIKLETDYREYCRKVIEKYSNMENVEIHLIPHVINLEKFDALENDSRICKLLHSKYKNTIVAPDFLTPIDAKSYISEMDIFIGARMHATIAAFSTGVVTIPFSYSKKFEGLFGNINYPYVISAREISTVEALRQTNQFIVDRKVIQECQKESMLEVTKRLLFMQNILKNILDDMEKG